MILPVTSYSLVLIAAAVIPAVYLMIKVYKSDKLEPESPNLLVNLVIAGILSSFLALIEEHVFSFVLDMFVSKTSFIYNIILYYIVVAVSEESSKYIMMKRKTWNSPEFDCRFDGVVYAVFVSLGFALWENISYVFSFGLGTALIRAITAVPGHACFGVFMGVFYTLAKDYSFYNKSKSSLCRKLALIVPVLLHGTYDYLATLNGRYDDFIFFGFIAILFFAANAMINKMAKSDRHLTWRVIG